MVYSFVALQCSRRTLQKNVQYTLIREKPILSLVCDYKLIMDGETVLTQNINNENCFVRELSPRNKFYIFLHILPIFMTYSRSNPNLYFVHFDAFLRNEKLCNYGIFTLLSHLEYKRALETGHTP